MRGRLFAAVSGAALLGAQPSDASGASSWASWSVSPRRIDLASLQPLERAALDACGPGEAGLREAARVVLAHTLRGLPLPDLDAVEAAQRAAGEPHPWPRVWAASSASLDRDATLAKLATWLGAEHDPRLRRCGVAAGASGEGLRAIVVIAVDALADLAPLPTRARAGQWLTVEARLRAPAHGGRVLVMNANEAPHILPSWFDGATLRARFAPDRPGEIAVQVVADLENGPRPVLEATVLADVEPPSLGSDRSAPGEETARDLGDDDRLVVMVAAVRMSAGLSPLARDARLDAVARAHARRMAAAHELAHDTGQGEPLDRLQAAGLDPGESGENVAHAATVPLAHRALWTSPSHRANLLGRQFDRLGVGVARDANGDVWAVETFAGELR